MKTRIHIVQGVHELAHASRRIAASRTHLIALLLFLFFAPVATACTACMGEPDAAQTEGMNAAILTMLGFTGTVLGGVGFAIGGFVYRMQRYDENGLPVRDEGGDRK